MTNEEFVKLQNAKLEDLRKECEQQVKDGELTAEDAVFRYEWVKDEILWMMDDPEQNIRFFGNFKPTNALNAWFAGTKIYNQK